MSQAQYIYDEAGRKKFVVLPIEEWEDDQPIKLKKPTEDLSKFMGCLSTPAEEIIRQIDEMRNEWERNPD